MAIPAKGCSAVSVITNAELFALGSGAGVFRTRIEFARPKVG